MQAEVTPVDHSAVNTVTNSQIMTIIKPEQPPL